jgi:hypothetical protein
MAKQTVNLGAIADDGTGDTLRVGGDKINDNFDELYGMIDTDGTLAANSDAKIATQKAVKTAIATAVVGLFDPKGSTDCSANPNYPAALKGDVYLVSVAGKIGGASGKVVTAGDVFIAFADNAGGTEASVGTSWSVVQNNITYAPVDRAGDTMTGDLVVPDEAYDATAWNGSLEVPTKNAVRDKIEAVVAGGGSFTAASTTEQLTGTDTAKGSTSDSVAALWEQGADVASAGTASLGEGGYFNITGTTTITDIDFGTDKAGRKAWVKFAGILTLTHNSSTLILPTAANIVTAAGDTACFVSEGSDVVRCVAYNRASGAALAGGSSGFPNRAFTNTLTNSTTTTVLPLDNTIPQVGEGVEALTLSITPTSSSSKIRVQALIKGQASSNSQFLVAALFINGGANAVEADSIWLPNGTGSGDINLAYEYVPGTTSAQTIAVRFGPGFTGPTITLNQSGSQNLGGVMKSSMVAYEVA